MLPPPLFSASCLELIPHAEVVLVHNPVCSLHAWLQLFLCPSGPGLGSYSIHVAALSTHFCTTNISSKVCFSKNPIGSAHHCRHSHKRAASCTTWSVDLWVHMDVSKLQSYWLYSWLHQVFHGFLFRCLCVSLLDHRSSTLGDWKRLVDFLILKRTSTTVGLVFFQNYLCSKKWFSLVPLTRQWVEWAS